MDLGMFLFFIAAVVKECRRLRADAIKADE